ncbi:hypothetical protein [Billgrantia desiderata]|nr:hypothetical protein [Halomonas desiderata]
MPGAPKKTAHGVMGGKIETASQSNSVSDCHRAVACTRYDSCKQKSSPLFDNFFVRLSPRPLARRPKPHGGTAPTITAQENFNKNSEMKNEPRRCDEMACNAQALGFTIETPLRV